MQVLNVTQRDEAQRQSVQGPLNGLCGLPWVSALERCPLVNGGDAL